MWTCCRACSDTCFDALMSPIMAKLRTKWCLIHGYCYSIVTWFRMWNFASSLISGSVGLKNEYDSPKSIQPASEYSDDDTSMVSREERLECPICWESFNIVENVPYVLWCGHTLCKNCILGLQWAVVKFPTLPIQLPLFISCPWCNLLSLRLVYQGNLKFPRKNYFLLWMVESMNGDGVKSHSTVCGDHQPVWQIKDSLATVSQVSHGSLQREQICHPESPVSNQSHGNTSNYLSIETLHTSLRKSLLLFIHLTAKFPLIIIFLLIVLYAIPASAAILALYILITILFALPSFLTLYFAYPSLDWLVREIINWDWGCVSSALKALWVLVCFTLWPPSSGVFYFAISQHLHLQPVAFILSYIAPVNLSTVFGFLALVELGW